MKPSARTLAAMFRIMIGVVGLGGLVSVWAPQHAWAARQVVQDEQEEFYADAKFTTETLTEGGISILGVATTGAPAGSGLLLNMAFELQRIIRAAYPKTVVLVDSDAINRIQTAGLQPDVTRWLQDVAEGRVTNRTLLPRVAAATGTRYFLRGEVVRFDKKDEEAPPFDPPQGLDNDVQPFLTRPKPFIVNKVVKLEAQIWDARSRGLVWRAMGGVRVIENQKAETHRMDDLFIRATKNLVALLPDKRLEESRAEVSQLETRLREATARAAQLESQLREVGRREAEEAERRRLIEFNLAEVLAAHAEREAALLSEIKGTPRATPARDLQAIEAAVATSLRDEMARGIVAALEGGGGQGGGGQSGGGQSPRVGFRIGSENLFAPNSVELTARGRQLLNRIVAPLTAVGEKMRVLVEGHTDALPVGGRMTEPFPTNWELSAAWATAVVRHLVAMGVDPTLLLPAGRGEQVPLTTNETEEGRRRNRRVEIVLMPQGSPL